MPAGFACIWCVSTLSSIKGGGGRLGWGKGQEKEKVEEGRGRKGSERSKRS